MDKIYINQLKVDTFIGCEPWEQQVKQTLVLDVVLDCCIKQSAAEDSIDKTLDYAKVAEQVADYLENQRFKLIETVAERTTALIHENFAVDKVTVKVTKTGCLPQAQGVAVEICR